MADRERSSHELGTAKREARSYQLAAWAAWTSLVIGCVVLLGWIFDLGALKSISPNWVAMKANTALGLAAAGGAAMLVARNGISSGGRVAARSLAAFVALLGLATLVQYVFETDLGIDELLFDEPDGAIGTFAPGRMAFSTAVCFTLLGPVFMSLTTQDRRARKLVDFLAPVILLVCLMSLIGYTYGVEAFEAVLSYSPMAVHTAVGLGALAFSSMVGRPDEGVLRHIIGPGTGAAVARRLLPFVVVIPLILGWLRLAGEDAGYFPAAFGTSAFVLAVIVIFATVLWLSARRLNAADDERAIVEERAERSRRVLQMVGEIAQAANEAPTVGAAFQIALDAISDGTGWEVGHAYLKDPDGRFVTLVWHIEDPDRFAAFRAATDDPGFDLRQGIGKEVIATGRPNWKEHFFLDNPTQRASVAREAGIESALAFPVIVDREVEAIIEFFSTVHTEPDPVLLETMAGIGTQLGRIIERVRAQGDLEDANQKLSGWISDLETRNEESTLLNDMSDLLQSCETMEEAYEVIGEFAAKLFPHDAGGLYIRNPSQTLVQQVVGWGTSTELKQVFAPQDCWALRRGRTYSIEHGTSELYCPHVETPVAGHSLCLPLIAQGDILGLMHIEVHAEQGSFAVADQRAHSMAERVGLAIANFRLRETLRNQSVRDPLTDLFNRRYVKEMLEREMHRSDRSKKPVSVIMLDVDHFKRFNDMYGHDAGDAVLKSVASALRHSVRSEDIPCRYGGEEFLIVLTEATIEDARKRAESLREVVAAMPLTHDGRQLESINLSLGVASYPQHGNSWEEVVAAADAALYRAKRLGRNRVVVSGVAETEDQTAEERSES